MTRRAGLTVVLGLAAAACHMPGEARRQAVHEAFTEQLQAECDARGLSGLSAACVLPDGEVVAVAVGTDAADVALQPTTRFLSGSIGKTYCAAICLQLVGEGRLELDGRIAEVPRHHGWFARIPNAESITLRQLLNHTAGIREHVWHPDFQKSVLAAGEGWLAQT